MSIDSIIFDLDGTILDTYTNQYEWFKHIYQVMKKGGRLIKPSFDLDNFWDYKNNYNIISTDLWKFYQMCGIDVNEATKKIIWEHYRAWKQDSKVNFFKGMPILIRYAHKVLERVGSSNLALNTSNIRESFRPIYSAGLDKYFKFMVSADDLPLDSSGKPLSKMNRSPYSLDLLLNMMHTAPEQTLHITDTGGDIYLSKNLDTFDKPMVTVAVSWGGFMSKQDLEGFYPDHMVETPLELFRLLKDLVG